MNAAEKRYWDRFHSRASGLERDVRDALLRAYAILRASLSFAELLRIIESRNTQRLLTDVLSDDVLDRALIPLRTRIVATAERGFQLTTAELPRAGKVEGAVAVHFDPLDPKVIAAIRELDAGIVDAVKQEVRDVVWAQVEKGLSESVAPRSIARDVPKVIGLGPAQLEIVDNFRATLAGEPGHSITDYALRDKRLDAMLEKGPLTTAQIERATERYQSERIAGNVSAVSQKTTRQSYRTGQAIAWRSAKESGVVRDGEQLYKQWLQVDRPSKRLSHAKMNGEVVLFDVPYSNGQMIPGEDPEDYNCACVSRILIKRLGSFITPPA